MQNPANNYYIKNQLKIYICFVTCQYPSNSQIECKFDLDCFFPKFLTVLAGLHYSVSWDWFFPAQILLIVVQTTATSLSFFLSPLLYLYFFWNLENNLLLLFSFSVLSTDLVMFVCSLFCFLYSVYFPFYFSVSF